ncbi:MAG: hypothetical protein DRR04_05345 [Gammaproteobacteria bacterium]|nr:MAG: hypothetical protein DRQ97_06860 [Gammaproteobacteria bacterium]RLA60553.1 MAG: hypothetical protein DRR04_05345 [Gammaproteobacteria bacterium]
MKYIPAVIIDELEDLKMEKGMESDSDAFREIANYSQVGREIERIKNFKFNHKPRGRPKKGGFLF